MAKGVKVDIDTEKLEALAARFWSNSEMAAFFSCSDSTITHKFAEIVQKGRESGKSRLRDAQLKAALGGNVTMLIWLGKQYLKQTDKTEFIDTKLMKEDIKILPDIVKPNGERQKFARFYN